MNFLIQDASIESCCSCNGEETHKGHKRGTYLEIDCLFDCCFLTSCYPMDPLLLLNRRQWKFQKQKDHLRIRDTSSFSVNVYNCMKNKYCTKIILT